MEVREDEEQVVFLSVFWYILALLIRNSTNSSFKTTISTRNSEIFHGN